MSANRSSGVQSQPGLMVAALGVVFGDIGTSPLYALRECLAPRNGVSPTPGDVLGVLSLIFWALVVVVTIKYVTFVLAADNHGEGGIFALLALVPESARATSGGGVTWMTALVLVGAGLLFGDGMITPSISVLSAMEGLEVAAPHFRPAVVPATCAVLVGLFALQSRGTGFMGRLFGPVMLVWFLTIGGLGAWQIVAHPRVLVALNPLAAARFLGAHGLPGFLVLASVALAVTGVEALYADLGHFGRAPIRLGWFAVVMPALILAYFGQGALMLEEPATRGAPFFAMVPQGPWTYALVGIATAAAVIASQALISGVFSLTHQAIQLGYLPAVTVKHTSSLAEGQVFVPGVNGALALACVVLVVAFRHSSRLAGAYGVAVTGTMVITSLVFFEVTRTAWRWPTWKSVSLVALFLSFELPLFVATLSKLAEGGFIPVVVGLGFFVVMFTWKRGWTLYHARLASRVFPLDGFLRDGAGKNVARVPGTGVFVSREREGVPPVLSDFVERIRALPERVVLLDMKTTRVPHGLATRAEALEAGVYRVSVETGFMDRVDVPGAVRAAVEQLRLSVAAEEITYYLGHHTFVATSAGRMGRLSESLFALLARNGRPATEHLGIPPHQVVELGSLLDL